MKISVFGLGYVGVVTAACFANDGNDVIGVDIQQAKVDLINSGRSPIIEDRIDLLVLEAVKNGKLKATTSTSDAIANSEIALVCVGTPSRQDGSLDFSYVAQVVKDIGVALKNRQDDFCLVIRSTIVPGTLRNLVIPILHEKVGRPLGNKYNVLFHPEFLREGTSVYDFYHPPKIVVGEQVFGSSAKLLKLYPDTIDAPRIICSFEVAEMVKYCDNLFHAVKVTFANEIGQFCYQQGIDSKEVMEIFCQDKKLNISPKYLRPGFAFGGSCLPKDLRAFLSVSRSHSLNLPMLEAVIPSNQKQIERVLNIVLSLNVKKIGFYGISFKPGTDDLRESPTVELAERLLGKGKNLIIYDEKVKMSRLVGTNKAYIDNVMPHIANLLSGEIISLSQCNLIVLAHPAPNETLVSWHKLGIRIVDLTGQLSIGEAIINIV